MADATTATPPAAAATPPAGGSPSPTVNTSPWYSDWLGQDGTVNTKSYERLPDHLKGLRPTLERQNNVEGILQALDHAQTLAGKKALAPLPPDAPEAVKAERKALLDTINGVPKEPKDYGVTRPNEIPERIWKDNENLLNGFTSWAHKYSVPANAVKELINEIQMPQVKANLAAQAQNEAAFWAKEQKTFDARISAENIPGDRAQALVDKAVVAMGLDANDPQTAIWLKGANTRYVLMKHAMSTGEDTAVVPGATQSGGGDVEQRIKEAKADPAYWNSEGKYSRTDHEAAVERVNQLIKLKIAAQQKGRK